MRYYTRFQGITLSDVTIGPTSEDGAEFTLSDTQLSWAAVGGITKFDKDESRAIKINYDVEREDPVSHRLEGLTGEFTCRHDGTDAWVDDEYLDSDGQGMNILGVQFDVRLNSGDFELIYKMQSSTGYDANLRVKMLKFAIPSP